MPSSHFVTVGNYRFHLMSWLQDKYWRENEIPILFLHGFMGSAEDWQPVIDGWNINAPVRSRHSPACLALDLPGHGKTKVMGSEAFYGMSPVAAGIVQLLDNLQIQTCGLVGYSMGGRLALYLMVHYPDRFTRVVLESASPGLQTELERQARRDSDDRLARTLETTDFQEFLVRWYQMPLFSDLNRHPDFSALMERRSHNSSENLGRSLRHMGTGHQPSLWEALAASITPLLLIIGEQDRKYQRIAADMGDRHPCCRIAMIPRSGHAAHIENCASFIQSLRAFFAPYNGDTLTTWQSSQIHNT